MTWRQKILRDLRDVEGRIGPAGFVYGHQLQSFKPGDQKMLVALNELVQEGLLEAIADPDNGYVALRLSRSRGRDVDEELSKKHWAQDPRFLIPSLVAIGGLTLAVLKAIGRLP